MAERELTYEDLVRIVELIRSTSHFSEFRLKVGDIEVSLRRMNGAAPRMQPVAEPETAPAGEQDRPKQIRTEFAPGTHVLRAPMVGTFYRRPEPTKPPFVEPGQKVEPQTVVCIIEVMKLMNSIEAGVKGVVREVLVDNAAAVDHGQPLMVIEPG